MQPLVVYIGYDQREAVSFHVLCHSILRRASGPVHIVPLVQDTLRTMGLYWRERSPLESTAFSITRFLVPALCGFRGHAVFLDQDMLILTDICELWDEIHRGERIVPGPGGTNRVCPEHAVLVCPHDYIPRAVQKMEGIQQTSYKFKNHSSFMVFNAERCTALTPEYVNTASGLDLHQFAWIDHEKIRGLPLSWNHLVGEDNQSEDSPRCVHFTNGGPWLTEYKDCEYADLWWQEYREMLTPCRS